MQVLRNQEILENAAWFKYGGWVKETWPIPEHVFKSPT